MLVAIQGCCKLCGVLGKGLLIQQPLLIQLADIGKGIPVFIFDWSILNLAIRADIKSGADGGVCIAQRVIALNEGIDRCSNRPDNQSSGFHRLLRFHWGPVSLPSPDTRTALL